MKHDWTPDRVMIIYAHPDDIEFAAAGAAAKWTRDGAEVVYVLLTDGNAGSHEAGMTPERLAEIRRAETRAAAEVAGVKTCVFLGYPDGLLQPTLEVRKDLVREIRRYKPTVVICGDPRRYFSGDTYVNHPDHRAAAVAALEAVFPAAEMEILYPDLLAEGFGAHYVNYVLVVTRDDPNFYVDISDTVEVKIDALRQHASQMGDWDPGPRIREWTTKMGQQVGFSHAEAFKRITIHEIEPDGSDK